ncbi:MAG: hypothetical protein ACI9N1_000900 [Flavobacteriales bacterium]|jgi:hypothetical protein
MKKLLLISLSFLTFGFTQNSYAQATEEGNVLIDVYYGFPNLYSATLKSAYANSGTTTDVKIGSLGPVGAKVEYMVSDKVGMGVDFNYTSTSVSYTEEGYDAMNNLTTYDYKVSRNVLRIFPRFNFHFGSGDSFDGYAGLGAGWRNSSWKFESTDPDYISDEIDGLLPVSFRLFLGGRYFFTDNIGMNLEFGVGGGALIQGGLALKF